MAAPDSPHPFVSAVLADVAPADGGAATGRPELVIFQGFTGDVFDRPEGRTWQRFYLDLQLFRWMIVEGARIRYSKRVEDEESPTEGCDYIWVEADALVGGGSGPQPVEATFLTGEFTRAADFEAPSTGGPMGGPTGPFCPPKSPLCGYCYRPPRTR
jgi:hypothetical protein